MLSIKDIYQTLIILSTDLSHRITSLDDSGRAKDVKIAALETHITLLQHQITSLPPSSQPSLKPDLSHRLSLVENKLKETENQSASQQAKGMLHYRLYTLD